MSSSSMTVLQQSAAWPLPAGEALRLDVGPGDRDLQVTQGRLWLTRAGTPETPAEDLWLQAGDTVALASGSEWVIEGWGRDGQDARFQLLVPPRACAALARRLSASPAPSSLATSSPSPSWVRRLFGVPQPA